VRDVRGRGGRGLDVTPLVADARTAFIDRSQGVPTMPCCEYHDRLDKKLHVHEFTGMLCGSHAVVVATPPGEQNIHVKNPVADPVTGEVLTKPHYCCFDCQTLIADKAAKA
jgi:hypothetical protein